MGNYKNQIWTKKKLKPASVAYPHKTFYHHIFIGLDTFISSNCVDNLCKVTKTMDVTVCVFVELNNQNPYLIKKNFPTSWVSSGESYTSWQPARAHCEEVVCVSMLVCVKKRERAYITAVNGWLYK